MKVKHNVSSKALNTFGIDANLSTLVELNSKDDYLHLKEFTHSEHKILGGGSNILITQDIKDPIIQVSNKGIELLIEEEEYVLVSVGAGENWHELVMWSIDQNYGGLENLSLIPGNAGTAPMQNIGAYGVEIKDCLHSLRAFDVLSANELTFHNQECKFGYRNSIFKNEWKGRFIISEIILKLSKEGFHQINSSYGNIQSQLDAQGISDPTIKDISNIVIDVRQSKLPDPSQIGNAGSFFKNPIISQSQFEDILKSYPKVPSYPAGNDEVKIPAGWLIEKAGWKGKQIGNTGTYKNQALVLVNHGEASGEEIYVLSEKIMESISTTFGIDLQREVNIW